jgi:protein-disulfide isomerase
MRRRTIFALLLVPLLSCASATPGSTVNAPNDGLAQAVDPAEQASNLHARMEAFRHLSDPETAAREDEELAVVWAVPVGTAPARGPSDAPVTIVEFGDFQCGFCVRAEKTLAQIRASYAEQVRFVWRDDPLPFHENAGAAAEFAREARAELGDAGFWAAHDALLDAHGDIGSSALGATARRLNLDTAKAARAIAEDRYQDGIDDDLELADDVGAEGTPTFFVNGHRIVGAEPFETWKPILDAEIAHARAVVAAGTPKDAVYETMIRGGQLAPDPRVVKIDVPGLAPTRGDPTAPVVIQEFADFECPYCFRAEDSLARLLARYPKRVRLVWRDLPLPMHAHAELAAEAASEAKRQKGNAGFWAMHDKLLGHQGFPHGLEKEALVRYASEIGLDVPAFEKALDSRQHAAEVTLDAKAAASVDIHSTPAFVVGGYVLEGAQPLVRFRKWMQRASP